MNERQTDIEDVIAGTDPEYLEMQRDVVAAQLYMALRDLIAYVTNLDMEGHPDATQPGRKAMAKAVRYDLVQV